MRTLLQALVAVVVALQFVPAVSAEADTAGTAVPFTQKIATDGFGEQQNSYSWSMAWFRGKLYVGTARSQYCVEGATLDFYKGFGYSANPGYQLPCPPDPYDMQLRAEIWQYTPQTGVWKRVYLSPEIPNPRAPGKLVARDIGYRGMVVFTARNGEKSLYVGGVTPDEYIPELQQDDPPRILRTTDGTHFSVLNGAPGVIQDGFGPQHPIGYRAMAEYRGRLFVTAGGGLTGDGAVIEVKDPSGPDPRFVQISPNDLAAFEMQVFDGRLYVGAGNATDGYSVWQTETANGPGSFVPVVKGGAGVGNQMTSVVSMSSYKGALYVGASGWGFLFPGSELIRIYRDDSWDLVVGTPRVADGIARFPISGLPDGYGNVFNAHFWRQQERGGALYVGTNDWSWAFRGLPFLGQLFAPEMGFDLYGTCDGQFWWRVTRDAFGNGPTDFGDRTMASTPSGAYLGTANHVLGTSVWQITAPSPCSATSAAARGFVSSSPSSAARANLQRARAKRQANPVDAPQKLVADGQRCGMVLSWRASARAARYEVLRADGGTIAGIRMPKPSLLPGGAVPDAPPSVRGSPVRAGRVTVFSSLTPIGTTSHPFFVDRSTPAGAAQYEVVAESKSGGRSAPSNLEATPSLQQPATFAAMSAAIRGLGAASSSVHAATARGAVQLQLSRAESRWRRGDRSRAMRRLSVLQRQMQSRGVASSAGDVQAREHVLDLGYRLDRHLRYAGVACAH